MSLFSDPRFCKEQNFVKIRLVCLSLSELFSQTAGSIYEMKFDGHAETLKSREYTEDHRGGESAIFPIPNLPQVCFLK